MVGRTLLEDLTPLTSSGPQRLSTSLGTLMVSSLAEKMDLTSTLSLALKMDNCLLLVTISVWSEFLETPVSRALNPKLTVPMESMSLTSDLMMTSFSLQEVTTSPLCNGDSCD
jgi:hypothetical protein